MDRLFLIELIFSLMVCRSHFGIAANWAQASGKLEQNIAISTQPSPSNPHWSPRYGASALAYSNGSDRELVYFLGGDSYSGNSGTYQSLPGNLDSKTTAGLKNDVWYMSGTNWISKGDIRLRTRYKSKVPQLTSTLRWIRLTPGLIPPPRVSYDMWIICQPYFDQPKYYSLRNSTCTSPAKFRNVQWSPRRHHATISFNGYLYLMGGRARELLEFPEIRSVGGVVYPRIMDPSDITKYKFTTQREASIVKNDVWRSKDGIMWELITPGCKRPQQTLLAKQPRKTGTKDARCSTDADCYGEEMCVQTTCVCRMWSPREQLSLAAFDGWMYVAGGFASKLYSYLSACGDYACGVQDASGYRAYLSDVWRSKDGATWELVSNGWWPGRGGLQLLAFPDSKGIPSLWVFGGLGGMSTYMNDTWVIPIPSLSTSGQWSSLPTPWPPRTGHQVIYDPPSSRNGNTRRVYVVSGETVGGSTLDDVWVWKLDDPPGSWVQDFSPSAEYSIETNNTIKFYNNTPTARYVYPDGDLSLIQNYFVPDRLTYPFIKHSVRPYITAEKLAMFHQTGVFTIRQLAQADLKTILKLRGFGGPNGGGLAVYDVCDIRAAALAILNICEVNPNRVIYDGQQQQPWNIIPVFGGPAPARQTVAWHGRADYSFLNGPSTNISQWDGCTYQASFETPYGANVPGLGFVSQVRKIADPTSIVNELVCRWTPGPRAYHSSLLYEGRLYTFAGKANYKKFYADSWYREPNIPLAKFTRFPKAMTPDHIFDFTANKPTYFEYRVWQPYKYKELRPWTPVTRKADVSWLNWRKNGPGKGQYRLYVRAVDPAGNKDIFFRDGAEGNVFTWRYVSPTAWDIILGVLGGVGGLVLLGLIEIRRRIRRAAVERYAMKRLRRKFKALQRDEEEGRLFDWRALYLEAKEPGQEREKPRNQTRRQRDRRKEKREKQQRRREREKGRIKQTLQDQTKSNVADSDGAVVLYDGAIKPTRKYLTNGSNRSGRPQIGFEGSRRSTASRELDEEGVPIDDPNRFKAFEIPSSIQGLSYHPGSIYQASLPAFEEEQDIEEQGFFLENAEDEGGMYATAADLAAERATGAKARRPNRRYHVSV